MLDDLPPPEIAREDLPLKSSIRFTLKSSVRFTLKSSVRFTPPPPEIAFISTFLPPKSDMN